MDKLSSIFNKKVNTKILSNVNVFMNGLFQKFGVIPSAILLFLFLAFQSVAYSQVIQLEGEDNNGDGLRMTFSYNQHMPGGQGMSLEFGFDFAELAVTKGVNIIPAVEFKSAYNIDIDDPSVKHLVQVGISPQIRISLDLTKPGWIANVRAIPWFGVSANGCWTRELKREKNVFLLVDSGWQLCYGPTLGVDFALGKNMMLSFGLETLFFALGNSGLEFTPFMMVGSRLGLGYKFLF